mmetsp:Transcript_58847/g.155777  ORF Transcript_58847/g.155777 Transcript_58847/m.155777 type:complete len:215 (-) Transcript_58847:1161-1805(-)
MQEDVESAGPRGCEGAPPPSVVLAAELEVASHDGDLAAGQDQDDQHQNNETEEIVDLMKPHRRQHVENLHEDSAEWQHAAHDDVKPCIHKPRLGWDVARDLIDAGRGLDGCLAEAEEGTGEHKGHGDAHPHAEQREERTEGHRSGGLLAPDEEVEDEEDTEADAREEHRGPDSIRPPPGAAEHLEEPGRGVASKGAHEDEEEQSSLHEGATVGR